VSARNEHKPRLLLIGPQTRADSPLGGTQVSFGELLERMRASGTFEVELIDTSRAASDRATPLRALGDAIVLLRTLSTIAGRGGRCDVALFNASSGATLLGGPAIALACKLLRVPLAVRVFGGNLDLRLAHTSAPVRALCECTVLASPLLLLQTHALCARFDARHNARWLPTTRDLPGAPALRAARCRRFLFLSQLRPQKGYVEAIAALERTRGDCTLTIGGPPMHSTDPSVFSSSKRVDYIGQVDPRDVPALLAAHDALLFPSYHVGEGMPGVIIEAMQSGLPVIATRWRALGELVDEGESGLLVEPRSVDDLARAMQRLTTDDELFARLQSGARRRGELFRAGTWHTQLERWLLELCGREMPAPPSPTARPVGARSQAVVRSAR
jgi:glycosyltransferase involved in cell wall biosynthesis